MNRKLGDRLSNFAKDEGGAATVFWLFCILILCAIVGLAVDVTNLHRRKERLMLAADSGAQSGIVALAGGKTDVEVKTAVLASVEDNAPKAYFGSISGTNDIKLVRFDAVTRKLASGTPNAVMVTLRNDESVENRFRTGFLRFVGFDYFDVSVTSVAYFGAPKNCTSSDMIYGKGDVTLTSGNYIGKGYCVHGQASVWLPQRNTFEAGSGVSMPNLSSCKTKCTDSANPGIEDAVFEQSLVLPKVSDHINTVKTAMLAESSDLKTKFFADKSLAKDLSSLVNAKILTNQVAAKLVKGSVVNLTATQYNDLMVESKGSLPAGLVYNVDCRDKGNGATAFIAIGAGRSGPSPGGKKGTTVTTVETVRQVAIITDCGFDVGKDARIDAAIAISTRVSNSSVIKSAEGAVVGDPQKNCDLSRKVYIMTMSGISVNANFTASNVALIVNGDINVAANSASSSEVHKGTSFFAEGNVHIAANNTFNSCAEDASGLIPQVKTFKFVIPRA